MGNVAFTPLQEEIFKAFSQDARLRNMFYFGGGTALSVFYLHHRYSEDLDFFSEKDFDKEIVIAFMNTLARRFCIPVKMTKKEMVVWFELRKGKEIVKVDFLRFPYPRIAQGTVYKKVSVDSPLDVGVNKLILLNLNQEPKDYVDLYFLLQEKCTIWDIIHAARVKFRLELDILSIGADFMNAQKLQVLPRMTKPLSLDELKRFFKERATALGEKVVG